MKASILMAAGGGVALLAAAVAWAQQPPPDGSASCPTGMVRIPEGRFLMGSPESAGDASERPQHTVQLSAYCMDRTEVRVVDYRECVTAHACQPPESESSAVCNWSLSGHEDHPVNCVVWVAAQAYCHWRGARLPTEAEWEYAARGADGGPYPWGTAVPALQLCWSGHTHRTGTCTVGASPAGDSPLGLHDLAGNVREWTADWYGPYTSHAQTNPLGPHAHDRAYRNLGERDSTGDYRQYRGSSWRDRTPDSSRAATRTTYGAQQYSDDIGFRCAQDIAR